PRHHRQLPARLQPLPARHRRRRHRRRVRQLPHRLQPRPGRQQRQRRRQRVRHRALLRQCRRHGPQQRAFVAERLHLPRERARGLPPPPARGRALAAGRTLRPPPPPHPRRPPLRHLPPPFPRLAPRRVPRQRGPCLRRRSAHQPHHPLRRPP